MLLMALCNIPTETLLSSRYFSRDSTRFSNLLFNVFISDVSSEASGANGGSDKMLNGDGDEDITDEEPTGKNNQMQQMTIIFISTQH